MISMLSIMTGVILTEKLEIIILDSSSDTEQGPYISYF